MRREDASSCCAHELVCRAKGDGILGPSDQARYLKLGEGCIHLARELLEDALGSGGLSATQDAGDGARLLEAPRPLVLMVVVIPSWQWQQRREADIALRTVLTRLVPPGTLTRLVLPVVLTRPVAPLLAGAALVPASSTSASSTVVASVVALGASTEAPIADGPELLAVIGVVAVHVVEDAERAAALG